jgi:hypothetical protein
MRGTR